MTREAELLTREGNGPHRPGAHANVLDGRWTAQHEERENNGQTREWEWHGEGVEFTRERCGLACGSAERTPHELDVERKGKRPQSLHAAHLAPSPTCPLPAALPLVRITGLRERHHWPPTSPATSHRARTRRPGWSGCRCRTACGSSSCGSATPPSRRAPPAPAPR